MRRRIISVFLVMLLLLPAAAAHAAGTPVTITSDDVRGKVGETVTVTLNIAIEPPKLGQTMDSLQFELVYDSSALEFIDIQEVSQDQIKILGVQYVCSVNAQAGMVGFAAATTDGTASSGVLMHVRFKILSAVSNMLVLKKVAYSFVNKNGTQERRQGGTINLGHVTGQSVPNTIAPNTPAPVNSQEPTSVATDEPRFPVTEVTLAPGASPTAEPNAADNDILAYVVFGLFIIVAILICVVLTLMIVRRGRNKARVKFFEDDEDEELLESPEEFRPDDEMLSEPEEEAEAEDDLEDELPIQIIRREKK